jgi:hypothetical protein
MDSGTVRTPIVKGAIPRQMAEYKTPPYKWCGHFEYKDIVCDPYLIKRESWLLLLLPGLLGARLKVCVYFAPLS